MHAHTDTITVHRQWWRNTVHCYNRMSFQGLWPMTNLSPLARAKISHLATLPNLASRNSSYFHVHEGWVTQVYRVYWTLALSWWFLLAFYSAFWYGLYFCWCPPAWDFWRCWQRSCLCLRSHDSPLPNLTAVVLASWKVQIMFFQVHCPSLQPSGSWEQPQSTPEKTDSTQCNWLEQWIHPYYAYVVHLGEF